MRVGSSNDPVASCLASLSRGRCARDSGMELDPRLVDRADRIVDARRDDRSRLRTSGLKRAFFDDGQFDDEERHGKRKLSEKLAEAIARFSSSRDRSKRPRYYETSNLLCTSGYVKSIVEKFSNSSFREDNQEGPGSTEPESFPVTAEAREVDCRIDRTPRPDFVEQIYLRASSRSESGELERIENALRVTADKTLTSITIDPRDITTGNVDENTTRLSATKDWISSSTVDGNQSDENGNVLIDEARNDETTCVNSQDTADLTSTKNERNFANPKRKDEESVATTIEDIVSVETFDEYEDIDKIDELLPVSPNKRGFLVRQDSVTQVITSMNGNIMPSQIVMNVLPKLDVSTKYNLDATTARLYHSLVPEALIEEEFLKEAESENDASVIAAPKSPPRVDICDGISGTVSHEDSATSARLDEQVTSMTSESPKNPTSTEHEVAMLLDWSNGNENDEWNFTFDDNDPNENSDVSGTPLCPMKDLDQEDNESFEKDISSSANEIIAHLDIREMCVCAANIVDDVISAVSSLDRIVPSLRARKDDDDENTGNYERSILIDAAKKIVSQRLELDSMGDDTPRLEAIDLSIASSDTDADEKRSTRDSSSCTGSSNSLVVIDEIVHHIVDKLAEKKRDVLHSKRYKESTNVGIVKEMHRTSSRASNDPEPDDIVLEFRSPVRYNRANNSFELNLRIEHDDDDNEDATAATKKDESDDPSWKSCESVEISIPGDKLVLPVTASPERPELTTSESTENDTKSDSSKENERSVAIETLDCRSVPKRFCFIDYDGPEETRDTLSFYEQDYDSVIRDAPLTCIPEEMMEEMAEELLDEFVQRLDQHCVELCNVASNTEDHRCDQAEDDTCNNTYTISDCSDEVSSEALYCSTYNADVSSSNDDTRQTSSALENDDAFDTTANYADVSTTTILQHNHTLPTISHQKDLSCEERTR